MKILHVSAYKEGSGGGEGRVTWELAHECLNIGIESLMLAPYDGVSNFTTSRTNQGLEIINYPSDSLGYLHFFNFSLKNIQELYEILDRINPDVIHFHTPIPLILLLELWAIRNSKKIVHTIHENPDKLLSYGLFKEGSIIDRLTKKIGVDDYLLTVYGGVDHMISVNNLHNNAIRNFGYKGKLTTIFNGRNLDLFGRLKSNPIEKNDIKLFFLGHLSQRKNQLYLTSVMEYLPSNFSLYLLGIALDKEYAKKLIGKTNVHVLGDVSFEKLPQLIENFDIFVSASLEEAFSLAVIEALAAGKPVVALENDTTNLLVNNTNGSLLKKNASVKQFASCVLRIAYLPEEKFLQMKLDARESVSNYDWSTVIHEYERIYLNLIKNTQSNLNIDSKRYKHLIEVLNNFFPKDKLNRIVDKTLKQNSMMKIGGSVIVSSLVVLLITTIYRLIKKK